MPAAAHRQRSRRARRLLAGLTLALAAPTATACGSSAGSGSPGGAAVAAVSEVPLVGNSAQQRIVLHVGDRFHLTVPAGAEVSELGVHELADEGGRVYRAIGVGTATLEVTRRPSCAPGQACSNLVQLVGTVRVTIKR